MSSRFIHVMCVCPSSLFQADWYFMVWMDHIYLSSSVDGHMGSFPILASVNKAAADVGVYLWLFSAQVALMSWLLKAYLMSCETRTQRQSKVNLYRGRPPVLGDRHLPMKSYPSTCLVV